MGQAGAPGRSPPSAGKPKPLFPSARTTATPAVIFDVSDDLGGQGSRLWPATPASSRRDRDARATWINDAAFLEKIERRARTWGRRAGVDYGEALCSAVRARS